VCHAQATRSVSERRASRVVGHCRATQPSVPTQRDDEGRLRARIIGLAHEYGRYGYRRITALLQQEGWRGAHQARHPVTATSLPGIVQVFPDARAPHDAVMLGMQVMNPHQ